MYIANNVRASGLAGVQPANESLSHEKAGTPAYPRVLLINGQAIGQKSGVGATLASMFQGWPLERLAQIVPPMGDPDKSVCKINWICGCREGAAAASYPRGIKPQLQRKIGNLRRWRVSPELHKWVADFDPDLIYSYLEHPQITCLIAEILRSRDIPVIPHLMDEWHRTPTGLRPAQLWWFVRQQIAFRQIIKQAPFGLAISAAMAKEYQTRYRRPFHTFMNSVAPSFYVTRRWVGPSSRLRLIYTGSGPGLGRWPIILNLVQAVQELNRSGCDIEFSAFVRMEFCDNPPVQGDGFALFDFIDERSLMARLVESDIAILPEGFDQKSITYSRLSCASKLPAYLMSGCCIMAIGPMQNNSIKYVRDNQLGVVLQDPSVQVLRAQLLDLYKRRPDVASFHTHNRQFALEHHSQPVVHEQLRILLNSMQK